MFIYEHMYIYVCVCTYMYMKGGHGVSSLIHYSRVTLASSCDSVQVDGRWALAGR